MGISMAEFKTALEVYGAKRLRDREIVDMNTFVPCFAIGNIEIRHSGGSAFSFYQNNKKVTVFIMAAAEVEFNKVGRELFNWVYSVQGLLSVATMIGNRYTKQLVDELTNKTYQRLFESSMIQNSGQNAHSSGTEELQQVLTQFDRSVVPFGNGDLNLKAPAEYLDELDISIELEEGDEEYLGLSMANSQSQARTIYTSDSDGWEYSSKFPYQDGELLLYHYYHNGDGDHPANEGVCYSYQDSSVEDSSKDFSFDFSLKTGLYQVATEAQITSMVEYLNIAVQEIQQGIISHMTND